MSMANTTFIAKTSAILTTQVPLPSDLTARTIHRDDLDRLAELWFAAYPPEIATDLAEALQEMKDMFVGEYGSFWPDASSIILYGDKPIAAICTVVKAPWEKTLTCPFIIDLMVHPDARRQGLAAFLLQETARAVQQDGKKHVALRVLVDNTPAITLYRKLGFEDWDGKLYAPK